MASSIIILLWLHILPGISFVLFWTWGPEVSPTQSLAFQYESAARSPPRAKDFKRRSSGRKSHCTESGSETCMRFIYWSCRSGGLDHVPSFFSFHCHCSSPSLTHTLSAHSLQSPISSPKYPQPLSMGNAMAGWRHRRTIETIKMIPYTHQLFKLKCPTRAFCFIFDGWHSSDMI